MKTQLRLAASLVLLAGLAGCDSIGDGNTIERLRLVVSPVETFEQGAFVDRDTVDERYYMYDCFCSNIAALVDFTDGGVADFSNRVTFTSDNPAVVAVMNVNELDIDSCPIGQQGSGLLIPKGLGTATITATFASLSATLKVEVADASFNADGSPASYVMFPAPPAAASATDVVVGGSLPLRVTGTLDGRTRTLNRNVRTWSFDAADDAVATIDAIGVVRGIAPSGASPKVARAAFGSCPDLSPTLAVNVGDVFGPLTLEREAPDFATDGMLAVNSDEELKVTASLDFDGDGVADGSQLLSLLVGLSYTDSCVLREYDATVPTTNCRETATTCAQTVPECSASTDTLCPSTLTPCRTEESPLVPIGANRILAVSDNGGATNLTATFPEDRGNATTLAAAVPDGTATTLSVLALQGYPSDLPWFGVIDAAGTREDVRVTAVDGTTLTVVRGVGGTTAVAHASGVSFEQRAYSSDSNAPLAITAKDGTLTTVAIDPPGTVQALGTLQLAARGTFVDDASAARQQRVTRLLAFGTGSPTVSWFTSNSSVATVSLNNGLLFSTGACGGTVSIRARASTSTDTTTARFDSTTTADDDACENTDPLCDQVEVCIPTPATPALGATCDTITTCP